MNSFLSNYVDVTFLKKFLILLIVIHLFNTLNLAITVPKGAVYSSFLDDNLNYIAWIRSYILHTSNLIAHIAGINTSVVLSTKLKILNGSGVFMDTACIGLGLLTFWIAFVLANPGSLKRKFVWCIVGSLCICLVNSIRVVLLVVAANNRWKINTFADHHTMFNIASYSVIALLIYFYINKNNSVQISPATT